MSQKMSIAEQIARELNVPAANVSAAIGLLDDDASVPFIARYRKELTGGLDDTQLRTLAERLDYLRDMEARRLAILAELRTQEKLTETLEAQILAAETKTRLEDLYLPYRPKRRTKASLAKEAGLEPLAERLLQNPSLSPELEAESFINIEHGIDSVDKAVLGARQILMEKFAEDPDLLNDVRDYLWQHGVLTSKGAKLKQKELHKFADYCDFSEPIKKIPSHRALALFRGRREGVLQIALNLPNLLEYGIQVICKYFKLDETQLPQWLLETVKLAFTTKLFPKLELELLGRVRELADVEAIRVFAENLRDLLLRSPAGPQVTIGLDPGIRTGVKVAVVDATGKLLDYTTIFPLAPLNEWHQSIVELAKLAAKYSVKLISIGNGTGSRETERLVSELIKMYPDLSLSKVLVSEAGASVYSASELAAKEFPELDVTLRGAVSIARRLQDPLAELVKIDPKAIGVGQYQHDVNQTRLARCLDGVVEDCVNAVGVDINQASVALLSRVSGLNETLAKNLVEYRFQNGAFKNRHELKKVERMGEKTFQQAAGFLRVIHGENPLDASGVHPEAYPIVEKILAEKKLPLKDVIGNQEVLAQIDLTSYVDETYGLPTLRDIVAELEKPGRDPRPTFKTIAFKDGVEKLEDLEEGMLLDGVVSNVTNFGAFVDIGVHQDGLVHISSMTNHFISDPRKVVKAGDIVQVKVIELDKARRRIGLTMKLNAETKDTKRPVKKQIVAKKPEALQKPKVVAKPKEEKKPQREQKQTIFNTAMADALSKLKR